MAEILASAMPVVDATATGVHLAWLGPATHLHSLKGWTIERRLATRLDSACEKVHVGRILAPEERAIDLGRVLLAPGVFPVGDAPGTVCVVELAAPVAGLHGTVQGAIACIVGLRHGKAVFALGPLAGPFDLGPLAARPARGLPDRRQPGHRHRDLSRSLRDIGVDRGESRRKPSAAAA